MWGWAFSCGRCTPVWKGEAPGYGRSASTLNVLTTRRTELVVTGLTGLILSNAEEDAEVEESPSYTLSDYKCLAGAGFRVRHDQISATQCPQLECVEAS